MSNRADLVRRLIAYEAGAKAIKEALKEEGRLEHDENGTAATYRMAFANVSGSASNDHVEVTDTDAFLAYMARRNPTEVHVVQAYAVRNPEWLNRVKEAFASLSRGEYDIVAAAEAKKAHDEGRPIVKPAYGQVIDSDGIVIPGVVFRPGGEYITTSVTPKTTARYRAIRAARKGALEGDWSELERVITEPGYLTSREIEEEAVATHDGREVESTAGL